MEGARRSGIDLPEVSLRWIARLRQQRIESFLQSNQTVLEWGDGLNLLGLGAGQKFAYRPEETLKVSLAGDGVKVLESLEDAREGTFDFIICDHVLEYLNDPLEGIESVRRVLKPGGRLVVVALYDPDFRRGITFGPLNLSSSQSGGRPIHLFSWNVQTLGNLLTDCQFTVESGALKRTCDEVALAQRAVQAGSGEGSFRFHAALSRLLRPRREVQLVARK